MGLPIPTMNGDRQMTKANEKIAKWLNRKNRILMLTLGLFATTLLTGGALWALQPIASSAEEITLYKNVGCRCCTRWANLLRTKGYKVVEKGVDDLDAIKTRLKVGEKFQSCHTVLIGGYVIEGHVPMKEIDRLLKERPNAKGLSVPGMPVGSPGMEAPGNIPEPYTVFLMKTDGSSEVYAKY